MNKVRKKILAMALGLLSIGKNFSKDSQAITIAENKKNMPNSDNFSILSYLRKYSTQLKFAGAGASAFVVPVGIGLLLNQLGKEDKKDRKKQKENQKENQKDKKKQEFVLQKIDNNPFAKVIPHYQWQNGNCFFLSSLYTIFGPENYDKYQKIAQMDFQKLKELVEDWCNNSERSDQECKDFLSLSREERLRKSAGFIELCKLYCRQKDFAPDNNKSFQIIPSGFEEGELEYENLICGCELKDRYGDGGPYKDVIKKFASEVSPFTYAIGDESIFFEWSPKCWQRVIITDNLEVKVPLERAIIRDENDKIVGEPIERYVPMDKNGKITVGKKNYYLVSISLGEGHIYCLQPKFSINKTDESIELSALLHLTCFPSPDELYSCKNIYDVFKAHTDRGYYFRFAPESAIRQYQDYYCMKN